MGVPSLLVKLQECRTPTPTSAATGSDSAGSTGGIIVAETGADWWWWALVLLRSPVHPLPPSAA